MNNMRWNCGFSRSCCRWENSPIDWMMNASARLSYVLVCACMLCVLVRVYVFVCLRHCGGRRVDDSVRFGLACLFARSNNSECVFRHSGNCATAKLILTDTSGATMVGNRKTKPTRWKSSEKLRFASFGVKLTAGSCFCHPLVGMGEFVVIRAANTRLC